jgi:hypothetical protein
MFSRSSSQLPWELGADRGSTCTASSATKSTDEVPGELAQVALVLSTHQGPDVQGPLHRHWQGALHHTRGPDQWVGRGTCLLARCANNHKYSSSGDVARHRRLLREGHQQKPQNEPRGRCWTDRGSCPEQRSVCCCAASGWPRRRPASICQRGVVTQDAESSQEIWRPLRQSMTKCPGSEAVVRVPRAMGQTAAAT